MKKFSRILRKAAVAAIGFPVVILGLILIPLPGPGLLVTLAGLFILAIEFEWAQRHKHRVKTQLNKVVEKARSKQKKPPPQNT